MAVVKVLAVGQVLVLASDSSFSARKSQCKQNKLNKNKSTLSFCRKFDV